MAFGLAPYLWLTSELEAIAGTLLVLKQFATLLLGLIFVLLSSAFPYQAAREAKSLTWAEEGAAVEAQPCLPKAPVMKEVRGRMIRDRRGAEERPDDEPGPDNEALSRHAGWQP